MIESSRQFEGREPEYRVYTHDKTGYPLYEIPDTDAPQHTDYVSAKEALDHVGRTGMAHRYDFDNGVFKRAKIDHYVIRQLYKGQPTGQAERYPAGWKRGEPR